MTAQTVRAGYEARLCDLSAGLAQARTRHVIARAVLIGSAALFVILGLQALRGRRPVWVPGLPAAFAAAAAVPYRRSREEQSRLWRLKRFYDAAIQRMEGRWAGQGYPGEEFSEPDHPYAGDLGIFGEGSLFEFLCIGRTGIGRRALAKYLLEPVPLDETVARQDAIRELLPNAKLREQIASLGEFEFSDARQENFAAWLEAPPAPYPPALRVPAAASSGAVALLALGTILGLLPWPATALWAAPFLLFHAAAGLLYRSRVNAVNTRCRPISTEIGVLREGLELLGPQVFQSAKLYGITARIHNASVALGNLERLVGALRERNKEWFYPPSLLLLAGTQLCMAIERWRNRHGAAMREWLDAWGEFEALNALANYAYENPDSTFPEFSQGAARFEAVALGHPLLPRETCVRNDVNLNAETRFYVISGSNMSGKSTLLRAVGVNAALAFTGAPVRAQALRLSPLSICASISVVDSLSNGKSRFLAEVDRLRLMVGSAGGLTAVLFLIDEIFGGTNSRDRRVAAEAVVRTLIDRGAIGALSTHDMALTEIAASDGLCGANIHMGAKDGGDPLAFDYRVKPGVATETNALAIVRMAGVPV